MWVLLLATSLVSGCDDEGSSENRSDLTKLLAEARSGDTVNVAAGTYQGSFEIPAGVTLSGGSGVVIVGPAEGPALRVIPGTSGAPTVVDNIAVQSGSLGVYVSGESGVVTLKNLAVESSGGVGVVIRGVDATLSNIALQGVITSDNDPDLNVSDTVSNSDTSILGLAVIGSSVDMSSVNITGFVGYGAVFYQSAGSWSTGRLKWVTGANIALEQTDLTLSNITVADHVTNNTVKKAAGYGLLALTGSTTTTDGLSIDGIQGIGVLVRGATASNHTTLTVTNNTKGGVHVEEVEGLSDGTSAFSMDGGSVISGNVGIGVSLIQVHGISMLRLNLL